MEKEGRVDRRGARFYTPLVRLHRSPLLATVLLLSACSAPGPGLDEPLPLPEGVLVDAYRFTGTGLGGPRPAEIDLGEDLVTVSIRCYYLERELETDLGLLVRDARFLANQRTSNPLQVTSLLASTTHIGSGSEAVEVQRRIEAHEAGRYGVILDEDLVLPVGATATLSGRANDVLEEPLGPWDLDPEVRLFDRELSLHISRRSDAEDLELLLNFEGPMPEFSYDPDEEDGGELQARSVSINERMARKPPTTRQIAGHESLQPERMLNGDGEPLVLLMASPFDHLNDRTFVILVEVHPREEPLGESEAAELRAELEASSRYAANRTSRANVLLARNRLLWDKFVSLAADQAGRRALILLADNVRAGITGDFTLVADDALLADFLELLAGKGGELTEPTSENAAWTLERTICTLLSERMGREDLPHEIGAILVRHLGEVGRSPATIEEFISTSTDLASFMDQVQTMNGFFLEDSDPGVRVRAYDWLAGRGKALPGYDPLAPLAERREALQRAEEAEQEAEDAVPAESGEQG